MAVVKKTKASDLHALCKKLVALLKKHYKAAGPKKDRPVLETMLYAVCLENTTAEQADVASARLYETYHDLNEVRVSTFAELTTCFEGMPDPESRAARVRAVLQYVFEINFDFDFEPLRRKTLELAEKQLQKIRFLTSFIQLYTLQKSLGTHMVPLDERMRDAAVWLGFTPLGCSTAEASDSMKSAVSKADSATFCEFLRDLATDERLIPTFSKVKPPEEGFDLDDMLDRVEELLSNANKGIKAKPPEEKKPVEKAKPAKPAKAAPTAKSRSAKKPR